MGYIIDKSEAPWSCLPDSLDSSELIDITCVSDMWRVYIDNNTGRRHDGAVYYKQSLDSLKWL